MGVPHHHPGIQEDFDEDSGPLRAFRLNQDVRFITDESPYKTRVGVTTTNRATGWIGSFRQVKAPAVKITPGTGRLASEQLTLGWCTSTRPKKHLFSRHSEFHQGVTQPARGGAEDAKVSR